MKKLIIILSVLFTTIGVVKAADSLYEYYQGNLPSIADRAKIATKAGIIGNLSDYKGTITQNIALLDYLQGNENVGGSGGLPISDYETTLTRSLTATDSTIYVASVETTDSHTITTADISPAVYLVLEPDSTTKKEIIKCTGISSSTFTGCTRGLAFYGTTETAVSDNRKAHSAGTKVSLSNVHFYYVSPSIQNTWTAIQIFASSTDSTTQQINMGTSTPSYFKNDAGVLYYCNNGASCAAIGGGANTYAFERPLITSGSNVKFASSTYDFVLRDNLFALSTTTITSGTASGKALDDFFNARSNATNTKESMITNTATTTRLIVGTEQPTGSASTTAGLFVGGNATTSGSFYVGGDFFGPGFTLSSTTPATTTAPGNTNENTILTYPISANSLGTKGMIKLYMNFTSSPAAGSDFLRVYYGGQQVCDYRKNATPEQGFVAGDYEGECLIFSHGATNKQVGYGTIRWILGGTELNYNSTSSAKTVDSTTAQNLTVTVQLGNNANPFNMRYSYLEVIKKN
ncbi:MAG: hypothetical protein WC549_04690 [Actinomycetota bacterium]